MMGAVLSAAVWLVLAAALQGGLGERWSGSWGGPDFLLVAAAVLSIHATSDGAAAIGFFAGLLHGAILNDRMAAFTISRTLGCFLAQRFYVGSLGAPLPSAVIATAVATLSASILYLLIGAKPDILGWLRATIGATAYNAALALPVYWLYRAIWRPPIGK